MNKIALKNIFLNMIPARDRPKIKVRLNAADLMTEAVAAVFILILIGLPVFYYGNLPSRIPVHFNASSMIDGYGSKSSLLVLPATGLFIYILMTVVAGFPHIFNYAVKITPENARVQYSLAIRLLRILKTVILIMFTFISYQAIRAAAGKTAGLGKVFLPVFLITTFGVVIVYMVLSLNNGDNP